MKERLLKFLEHLRIGQTKFEAATGLSNGLINNIKGSINVDTLAKIKRKYPELSLDWLVMGEGEMLVSGDNNIQVKGDITGNVVGSSGNTVSSNSEMTRWLDVFNKRYQQFDERMAAKDRVIAEKDRQIAQQSQTIQTLSEVIKKNCPKICILQKYGASLPEIFMSYTLNLRKIKMEVVVYFAVIVWTILSIILFFKIWGMTNHVRQIKNYLVPPETAELVAVIDTEKTVLKKVLAMQGEPYGFDIYSSESNAIIRYQSED